MKNEVKIVENNIFITYNGKMWVRYLNDILFCESCCHYSEISFDPVPLVDSIAVKNLKSPQPENTLYMENVKPLIAPIGINRLAMLLPGNSFCKIHRHFIIYLGILKKATLETDNILFGGRELPVSRYNINELLEKLNKFHFPNRGE